MTTVEQDAAEYGLHVHQGGWRLGLLVARNVQKGTAGRPKNHRVRDDSVAERNGHVAVRA